MKAFFIGVLYFFLISPVSTYGQDRLKENSPSIGFQVNQFQRDFGIGIQVTSRYATGRFAVRVKASMVFNEHLQNGAVTWTPYSNVSLGLVGVSGYVGDYIRLYGEGGVIGLFPAKVFSSETFRAGGYGLFGFEFFLTKSNSYFLEIGGVGTGAKADAIATQPIYSNGLLLSVGFRMNLKGH